MKPAILMLGVLGCANASMVSPPYDETAAAIGSDVAQTVRAAHDLMRFDQLPRDTSGFAHVDGFTLWVNGTQAFANWPGHTSMFALRAPFLAGPSHAELDGIVLDEQASLLVGDTAIGGSITVFGDLPATVVLEATHPRIDFDAEHAYWIDLATGEVSAPTQIE